MIVAFTILKHQVKLKPFQNPVPSITKTYEKLHCIKYGVSYTNIGISPDPETSRHKNQYPHKEELRRELNSLATKTTQLPKVTKP